MAPYKVFITDDTETVRRTATSLALDDNATVEDMKKALSYAEGFHEERYRILYRKPTHDEALDDDDILSEVVKEDGNSRNYHLRKLSTSDYHHSSMEDYQ